MITKTAKLIAKWLLKYGAISNKELDEYTTAAECFLIFFLPIVITTFVSLLAGNIKQGLCFIAAYSALRKFSGGFHLQNQNTCLILSSLMLTNIVIFLRYYYMFNYMLISIMAIVASIIVVILSPVDSVDRKLTNKERKVFKRVCALILSNIVMLIFVFVNKNIEYAFVLSVAVVFTMGLQLPCLFQQFAQNVKNMSFHS